MERGEEGIEKEKKHASLLRREVQVDDVSRDTGGISLFGEGLDAEVILYTNHSHGLSSIDFGNLKVIKIREEEEEEKKSKRRRTRRKENNK